MAHLRCILAALLLAAVGHTQVLPPAGDYAAAYVRHQPQNRENLLQQYNQHSDSNNYNYNYNHYPYNPDTYQGPVNRNFQQHAAYQVGGLHNRPETTLAPTQAWSGAPIVVDYNDDYADRGAPPSSPHAQNAQVPQFPARNYGIESRVPPQLQSFIAQTNSRNTFKALPTPISLAQQQQQPQPLSPTAPQERNLSYYPLYMSPPRDVFRTPTQTQNARWSPTSTSTSTSMSTLRNQRLHAHEYASHFEHYVRKYPRRLEPVFEPLVVYSK